MQPLLNRNQVALRSWKEFYSSMYDHAPSIGIKDKLLWFEAESSFNLT